MKAALRCMLIMCISFLMFTCKKDTPGNYSVVQGNKISISVSGRVTDELGKPVKGANVIAGTATASTDVNGKFSFSDVSLFEKAAFIKVEKTGYFTGSRTFFAKQGQQHFVEIQLIQKVNSGNINASSGGTVVLTNGSQVTLPAGGVIVASTGSAYTGNVQVAMTWLDPTSSNLSRIMPGDLRGVDTDGAERGLMSYGMIGVELTGSNGEKLQITNGKKASLKFPLPISVQASAPATIALWSFDETTGLWKQEGNATKVNNKYEAEVSHFSFWNCDVPFTLVNFSAVIKDQFGQPLTKTMVRISRTISGPPSLTQAVSYTDNSGTVTGYIPQNEALKLEVITCGSTVYSQNIGPFANSAAANIGTVTVNASTINAFIVTGTAKNCSNSAVMNGYVEVRVGTETYRSDIVNGGFSLAFSGCSSALQVTYAVVDNLAAQQSSPVTSTLNVGTTTLGSISACGVSTQQFIVFDLNGVNSSFSPPSDSVFATGTFILGYRHGHDIQIKWSTINENIVMDTITSIDIVTLTSQGLIRHHTPSATIKITENGPIGGYRAGTFYGQIKQEGTTGPFVPVTGSFRAKRKN